MLRGKVALWCAICALGLTGVLCTSALAGPALTEQLAPGATLWNTDPAVPPAYFPDKFATAMPPGMAGWPVITDVTSSTTGDLAGDLETKVYKDPATGYLTFDYVLSRDGGDSFIVGASLGGNGWNGLQILGVGIGTPGTSGTGYPQSDWTNGAPYYISRDPNTGVPSLTFRGPGFTDIGPPPDFRLVGTVIGNGDTSAEIWFQTNATEYDLNSMAVLGGAGESGRYIDIPVPRVVPEPTSLLLLGVGALLILPNRRGRRA